MFYNFAPLGLYCIVYFVSQALRPVLGNFAPPGLCLILRYSLLYIFWAMGSPVLAYDVFTSM